MTNITLTEDGQKLRNIIDNKYLKIKTKKDRDTIDIEYFFLNPHQYEIFEKMCDKLINRQKKKHREYQRKYYSKNKDKILAKYHENKKEEETLKLRTFYDTIEEDDEIEGETILI
jgi:hypothetical protein